MKKYIKDYAVLLSIAGCIIVLDQLTKTWVRNNVHVGTVLFPELWLSQYARIIHVHNRGAAFGMLQDLSLVFTVLSFVVAGFILFYFPHIPRKEWTTRLALSMLLGGAVGNLVDRLTQGYVTDFVSLGPFPVFNVADASISFGVVVLALGLWIQERHTGPSKPALPDETQDERIEPPAAIVTFPEEARGE